MSNGLRGRPAGAADGAVGTRVRRMGWPFALAPSKLRIAVFAEERDSYVTNAVPDDRPARS